MTSQPVTGPDHSRAQIATAQASRYLQQLCKHFAHKLPATFDAGQGRVEFAIGICDLQADGDTLTIDLAASDGAQLEQFKDVVVRHLLRFAFREELAIVWQDG